MYSTTLPFLYFSVEQSKSCPYCGDTRLIKRGLRKSTLIIKQRYSCKSCNRRCILGAVQNIKGDAYLVCLVMDLFYKGNSLRDISDTLQQFAGIYLSHETIRNWIRKFSRVLNDYSKELVPHTSGVWNADETLILTKRGKTRRKLHREFDYLWNVIDRDTKFVLASQTYARRRGKKEVREVMYTALKQNKIIPRQIITDRLPSYQDGISKAFRNWGNEKKVRHTSILGRRKYINNNVAENFHSTLKEFYKGRRGVKEIQDYADGYRVFHNFIKKGVKDGKTPAERAELTLPDSPNRWVSLLSSSTERRYTL